MKHGVLQWLNQNCCRAWHWVASMLASGLHLSLLLVFLSSAVCNEHGQYWQSVCPKLAAAANERHWRARAPGCLHSRCAPSSCDNK